MRQDLQDTFNQILGQLQQKTQIAAAGGVESWKGCCPAHADSTPSLHCTRTQTRILFKCFAGCNYRDIAEEFGLKPAKLFGDADAVPGYSVLRMAIDRKLPREFLIDFCKFKTTERSANGTTMPCVEMPYFHRDGTLYYTKQRRSLKGKGLDKFWAPKGQHSAYGLWLLDHWLENNDTLTIVEGETDAVTLWYHNIPALGIPGADGIKLVAPAMLAGFKKVLIWREPDQGGVSFAKNLSTRIDSFMLPGLSVQIIYHPQFKDPSLLHCSDPDTFKQSWAALAAASVPPPPPAPSPQPAALGGANAALPSAASAALPSAALGKTRVSRWNLPVRALKFGELGYEFNEIAARCARLYSDILRYDIDAGQWFQFNGKRWDSTGSKYIPRAFIYTTIDGLYEEAETITGDSADDVEARAAIIEAQGKLFKDNIVFRIADQLSCEEPIRALRRQFDSEHHLINFHNGTFNVQSAALQPHSEIDLITHMAGTEYDPEAKCPIFLKFLHRIFDGSQEMIDYFQEIAGYTATGFTREQCLFFLFGKGSNGKSSCTKILSKVLGTYFKSIKADSIIASASDKHSYDLADLAGARMALCSELPQDRAINESLIKEMVSEDPMKARFIYQGFFNFEQTHKLWMYGNHKPTIRGNDEGIWRRVRLIDMSVQILESEKDRDLPNKLATELKGIAAWVIVGAIRWYRRGRLVTPDRIDQDTQAYRESCDALKEFVEECCTTDDAYLANKDKAKESKIETKQLDLYRVYVHWSRALGERYQYGRTSFAQQIRDRGFLTKKRKKGEFFQGILVKDEVWNEMSNNNDW